MYSLPIATYGDYWRSAKNRSLYIGSGLLLAGTTFIYAPVDQVLDYFSPKTTPQVQPIDESSIPKALTPSEDGSVKSTRITTEFKIVDMEVPIETEYVETSQLAPGMSKVKEEGKKGIQRQVIKTTRIDGEINSEQITYQFMLEAPKKRVVIRNSQPVVAQQRQLDKAFDPSKLNVQKILHMEATAYTYTGFRTATGVEPREGLIAVDPRVIPLGTQVYVEGYGYAVAADTGAAIKGNIIDVFYPSLQRCLYWGRRPVEVYVLKG